MTGLDSREDSHRAPRVTEKNNAEKGFFDDFYNTLPVCLYCIIHRGRGRIPFMILLFFNTGNIWRNHIRQSPRRWVLSYHHDTIISIPDIYMYCNIIHNLRFI